MFVVAGVSGNTGKVVANTLLAAKQPVRVIVRSADKGAEWKARGAEVSICELDDVAGLKKAFMGAAGAYLLLPPQMASLDARGDNGKRTAGYIRAIEGSSLKHVVLLSSMGAQHPAGTGPIGSLHDAERAFRNLGAAVTFIRAANFMENLRGSLFGLAKGEFPTFLHADRPIPMVATQDIGTTAAAALLEGGKGKRVIELSGPREYSPNDVAAALSSITGKSVIAAQGPEEAMVPALMSAGLNDHWAGMLKEMTHGVNVGHVVFEGGQAQAVRGTTDVATVLKSLLAAR